MSENQEFEARLKQMEERVEAVEKNNKQLEQALFAQGKLVEESLALIENSAGLFVEHTTSLDSRLNEAGEVFVEKIRVQMEKAKEAGTLPQQ